MNKSSEPAEDQKNFIEMVDYFSGQYPTEHEKIRAIVLWHEGRIDTYTRLLNSYKEIVTTNDGSKLITEILAQKYYHDSKGVFAEVISSYRYTISYRKYDNKTGYPHMYQEDFIDFMASHSPANGDYFLQDKEL